MKKLREREDHSPVNRLYKRSITVSDRYSDEWINETFVICTCEFYCIFFQSILFILIRSHTLFNILTPFFSRD